MKYTRQKAIFSRLCLKEQVEPGPEPISRMRQIMLCLMCLSISTCAHFTFQYYLSAGQVLFPPYMISWMVFAGVLSLSITLTFLYQDPLCRSLLWCGFISMSATLGMVFLAKLYIWPYWAIWPLVFTTQLLQHVIWVYLLRVVYYMVRSCWILVCVRQLFLKCFLDQTWCSIVIFKHRKEERYSRFVS